MENQNFNYSFIKEIIVGISAIVGMVLGIYNLYNSIRKDKVRLKIIPKTIMFKTQNVSTNARGVVLSLNDFTTENDFFAFEIINQSNFPVVIDEIGLKVKNRKGSYSIPNPILPDKGGWPRELNPRNSFVAYARLDNILSLAKKHKIISSYVKTTCDTTRYGSSKALELLIRHAKENV